MPKQLWKAAIVDANVENVYNASWQSTDMGHVGPGVRT